MTAPCGARRSSPKSERVRLAGFKLGNTWVWTLSGHEGGRMELLVLVDSNTSTRTTP